jgi:hypothetical protein
VKDTYYVINKGDLMGRRNREKRAQEKAAADFSMTGAIIIPTEPWTKFERAVVPGMPDEVVYKNSRYQVWVRKRRCPPPFGDCYELSIKTLDKAPVHDWRDLQRIKNELMGPEVEALELYPAESRLVDTANQYFLHCFPNLEFPDKKFPFGFRERLVAENTGGGAVQRPFAPEHRPSDLEDSERLLKRMEEELKKRGKKE